MKSTRVKLKNCWYRVQSWWQIVFGSIRAVNSWRGGNSKDDDTTKTWKEIRLNIKGIREALEEIDRVLKEFLQKKKWPFWWSCHQSQTWIWECYFILSYTVVGKIPPKIQPMLHSVHSKSRWTVGYAISIVFCVQEDKLFKILFVFTFKMQSSRALL